MFPPPAFNLEGSMKINGFAKAEPVNPMDPEYVKLQRADVIKKYQDEVAALKLQVEELEAKKKALASEIMGAFSAERAKIEELEMIARARKESADQEVSVIRGLREKFESEKKSVEYDFSVREKEIEANIQRNRNMLDAINAAHEKERALALKNAEELKSMKDERAELEAMILKLGQDRINLEADQLIVKNAQADQARREEEINLKMKLLSDETAVINREKEALANMRLEIEAKDAVAQEAGRSADISIATLKELKAKTDEETLSLRAERQKLSEWERQLTIREKAFNNDSAVRKRDLDDRESRIKSLESKLGG
jgi:hypothetical protein